MTEPEVQAGSPRRRGAVSICLAAACLWGCAPALTTGAPDSPATFNPPTGLIDIGGGRHLEIACEGGRGPVVVLEAGLGNTLDVWSSVMARVSTFATVCAYNRAGLGRSDARPEPHGAQSAVDDLHALLAAARLPSPYVLVGASFGGLDAQLFASRYPSETQGVVLVDSLAPDWDHELEGLLTPS